MLVSLKFDRGWAVQVLNESLSSMGALIVAELASASAGCSCCRIIAQAELSGTCDGRGGAKWRRSSATTDECDAELTE